MRFRYGVITNGVLTFSAPSVKPLLQRQGTMTVSERVAIGSVTLAIPGEPAWSFSPNGGRKHWAVKQKEIDAAGWAVKGAEWWFHVGDEPSHDPFTGPVKLHWIIYLAKGGKRRDNDNVLPCLKPYQDALVREGIIGGDSPRYIPKMPTVEQIRWSEHRGDPCIAVRILEIPS